MRVDLHFHLLPGVDDSARTLDESVELAQAAVADGTGTVVATPHVRRDHVTDVTELPPLAREVQERLAREEIELEVELGGELSHEMVGLLSQSELETIAVGPPGRRWVLLEVPFGPARPDLLAACGELRDRGFGIVFAHPERSGSPTYELLGLLGEELAAGALLQVNAWSLEGAYGAEAQAAARRLVSRRLASVLASDAHAIDRLPALRLGERLAHECGLRPSEAAAMVAARPGALVVRGMPSTPAPASV